MNFEMFSIVIIVNRDIHAMAPVKAEWTTLFGFSANIDPHNLTRTIYNFVISVGNFITYEEVWTFDGLGVFCARE